MIAGAPGLLLAAHGERRNGSANRSVETLVRELRTRGVAAEVRCGYVKRLPALGAVMRQFLAAEIVVCPLFLADGYFTRVRLPQLLGATDRTLRILPPIGLHPALARMVGGRAGVACTEAGLDPARATLVLVAHGSTRNPASRLAAGTVARAIAATADFAEVRVAFLEEAPGVTEALASTPGPAVVVGLFMGEGLHGRDDVGRLIAAANRDDVRWLGSVGAWPELADVVGVAVREAAVGLPPGAAPRPARLAPAGAARTSAGR